MELFKYTAHQLHEKLVSKEISAVELTKSVLARVDAVEKDVQSYITQTRESALEQAEAVDAKIGQGQAISTLAGIPGALKDNMCTKGTKTTCASKILANFIPPYNATVVEKLMAEDTVVIGKANMDEFAMGGSTENSGFFPTRNPWDLATVPGGSSGGSAAAVAAGEAIWALGSDTGGSIRQPAAYCGIVGVKPTYGRVSRYGLVAFASSLEQIGPMTKDVKDAAIVLQAIAGHDLKDSTSSTAEVPDFSAKLGTPVKGLKVGLPKEYFMDGLHPELRAAVMKAAAELEAQGAIIQEVSLPHTEYALSAYYLVAPAEASSNLGRFDGVRYGLRVNGDDVADMTLNSRTLGFGPEVKRRIMLGTYALRSGYHDAYYLKALQVRRLIQDDFNKVFKDVDVLLTPTTPQVAFRKGEKIADPLSMYMEDICTIPVNMAGLPALSMPCGFISGMPMGLQIIGKPMDEATILQVAYAYEQSQDFHQKRPELAKGGVK